MYKSSLKILARFGKSEAYGETLLPDRLILIGKKREQAKIKSSNATFRVIFKHCKKAQIHGFYIEVCLNSCAKN